VQVGDGRPVPIIGVGTLQFSTRFGNVQATVTIHNVCHAPHMTYNLISEGVLDDAGYHSNKKEGVCVVRNRKGQIVLVAPKTRSGQLYQTTAIIQPHPTSNIQSVHSTSRGVSKVPTVLSVTQTKGGPASTSSEPTGKTIIPSQVRANSAAMWHARLGHPSPATVLDVFRQGLVTGVDCEAVAKSIHQSGPFLPAECDACMIGKSHRQPFTGKAARADHPLHIIHTDIGSVPDTGLNGTYYYLTITDDFTRWVYVATTSRKDGASVGPLIKDWITWAERHHSAAGHKVRIVRSDGGGEYVNDALKLWFRERGINQQITNPHTPQLNGVAERLNRTLMEKVRTILYQSGLPARFWSEAIKYAAYTHNRLPHRSLTDQSTPYTLWTGKLPSVKHLRPFGIVGYHHIPHTTDRKKLHNRSNICVLVGYATQTKGWRLWYPYSWHSHIVESRDVDWREWQYWRELSETNSVDNGKGDHKISHYDLPTAAGRGGAEKTSSSSRVSIPTEIGNTNTNTAKNHPADDEEEYQVEEVEEVLEPTSVQNEAINASPAAFPHMSREMRGLADVRGSGSRDPAPSPLSSQQYTSKTRSGRVSMSQALSVVDARLNPEEEPPEPRTYKEAMRRSDAAAWKRSMDDEMNQLNVTSTWELVPFQSGMNVVGCKWVYKLKTLASGATKEKSRLVAQGFTQKPGVDFDETYSPVVRYASLRCLLALAAHYDWEVHHMDVKSAYLNGKLEETIYMQQPEGYIKPGQERLVCRLKKGLYGLKQAGRTWHQTIDPTLKRLGLRPLGSDYCVYLYRSGQETITICLYVDDLFLFTSSTTLLKQFKRQLMDEFEMEDLGEARLVLGMLIARNRRARILTISQQSYLEKALNKLGAAELNSVATPIDANTQLVKAGDNHEATPAETTRYQSIIGTLQYAANGTRPDIAYAINQLARYSSNPDDSHFTALKRVLRYVKGTTDRVLTYTGTNDSQPRLTGYSDADYANCKDDRLSITGYAFMLGGAAISWSSRRQKTVAQSTVEAEYMATAEAVKEAMWWRSFLGELGLDVSQPTPLFSDNQGSIHLAKNSDHHARTKHIDVKYHLIRQELVKGTVTLNHVSTQHNIADILTKGLVRDKHNTFRAGLGLSTPTSAWGSVEVAPAEGVAKS
jgi:transposase InsO family protein